MVVFWKILLSPHKISRALNIGFLVNSFTKALLLIAQFSQGTCSTGSSKLLPFL